jgi:hypothetical protein
MDKYGISMNFASAQEHVPEAERNNRVIKERFRATFHQTSSNYGEDPNHGMHQETQLLSSKGWCL